MSTDMSWQKDANCKTHPTEIFYPPPEELKLTVRQLRERAQLTRDICDECIVKEPCLEYALENESDGFWGGMTPRQRLVNRRSLAVKFNKRRVR